MYKRQGLLFKKIVGGERDWRLVVPEGLEEKIIWDCHIRYGHFGAKKCVNILKESCIPLSPFHSIPDW